MILKILIGFALGYIAACVTFYILQKRERRRRKEKKKKILPASRNVHVSDLLLEKLSLDFGEKIVKAVQKRIENMEKMN
mgnify:CR=1 FL=1